MAKKGKESIDKKLTVKQENFCNFYVEAGNASVAYRKAYSCDRMKDKTINERSSRLLREYKISTRVKELQDELKKRSDITKDEAVKELTNMVRTNIADFVEVGSSIEVEGKSVSIGGQSITIKDLSALTVEQQRCIKSITPTKGGIKIEMYDKIAAIDRLSKMLGWDEATKHALTELPQVTVFEIPDNGRSKDK